MKRREPLPDLAHVLEDSRPHRAELGVPLEVSAREKRVHTRFDKAFLVMVGSELYGDTVGIARNVSAGGILVELSYAPPLGTIVTVHFQYVRGEDQLDEIVARAEVKHHHYLNFASRSASLRDSAGSGEAASSRAVGLRFLEFVDAGECIDADRLH